MAVLSFVYHMEMHYEEMVRRCYFTMKCIPREDKRQRLREIEIALLPDTEFSWGEDSFGNRQIFGSTFLLWIFPAAKMIYPCAG